MKNSLETRLGIFVVLVIFAAVFIVEILGGLQLFRGGYHVRAQFDSAQDLKVGSSVKMAGVEIGRVENIGLDATNNKVTVTMKLHPDAVVRTDSKAAIKFTGLMGQYFVSIDFGSPTAPQIENNGILQAQEQPDFNAIMVKLDNATTGMENLFKSFSGEKLDNLVGPLMDFFKQNNSHIGGAISNIENITAQISSGQGTVGKLIYDQTLYDSAMVTVTNLQDTVVSARAIMAGITNGQGTIGKLITDDTLYTATTASMTNLNQILQRINQGQGSVGKLVNDQEFYKNAKLSLQKLDKMADSLEDQGPISVIGLMVGNLL